MKSDRDDKDKNSGGLDRNIIDAGAAKIKSGHGTVYFLTIIGQIEGHQTLQDNTKTTKYEHILPLLASIEEDEEVDGVLLLLNTVGGDIEAGLAIAELIAGMKKPTVSLVLGGGHSIGVPLAVSAKRSMIVPSASMTIHPVRMTGMMIAAPQTFHYFNRIQERIISFVARNSRISPERFRELMLNTDELAADTGSVLYGEDAVREGLIDRIGSLGDALESIHGMIDEGKRKKASSK